MNPLGVFCKFCIANYRKYNHLKYSDHISHYQADAELCDYFEETVFIKQANRRRYESFAHLHAFKKGQRVLEIGAGGGPALQILKHKDVVYYPLDIPILNLQGLKSRADFPIHPLCGDVFKLPLQSGSVDVIIMSEVLEHLEEPQKALDEVQRILVPGGVLIISVPYKEVLQYQVCVHCNQLTPKNAHFHSFNKDKLHTYLNNSGLAAKRFLRINNKVSERLYLNILLRFLPFTLWKLFDGLVNTIIPKANQVVVKAIKNQVS